MGSDGVLGDDVLISRSYSVPAAAKRVYEEGILSNPLIAKDLPKEVRSQQTKIVFTGSDSPSIPVNWRFAEAVSSLKALEAALVDATLQRRYGIGAHNVNINTDHATLFLFSTLLWTIDPGPGGENISATTLRQANEKLFKYFPNCDQHRMNSSVYRNLATNIYKCADERFFQAHGSMNPTPVFHNLGLPAELDVPSYEDGMRRVQAAFSKVDSEAIQRLTDKTRQAGSICYTVNEYLTSEHGRANQHVGLWEIHERPNPAQGPCWWGSQSSSSLPSRPLAGLKVVDLTRIIAGPSITRSLAELGASVMRCTAPHLPDVVSLQADLNWGKWNCSIDLRNEDDCRSLKALILEADVVVQGYRPSALDKYGFGQEDILSIFNSRGRGGIYVRENCYGWHGPWKDRSGWQQTADANTGLSKSFGEAMGHGEPVTPLLPHSDYCTGIAGSCTVLIALLRRASSGGSYCIDLALNYYSAWLINSVGTYPTDVFNKVWAENDRVVFQSWQNNGVTLPQMLARLRSGPGGKRLFKPEFYEDRSAPNILASRKFRCVKGVADWGGIVQLGFNVGTRGNGVDAPKWPTNLMEEVVVQ